LRDYHSFFFDDCAVGERDSGPEVLRASSTCDCLLFRIPARPFVQLLNSPTMVMSSETSRGGISCKSFPFSALSTPLFAPGTLRLGSILLMNFVPPKLLPLFRLALLFHVFDSLLPPPNTLCLRRIELIFVPSSYLPAAFGRD